MENFSAQLQAVVGTARYPGRIDLQNGRVVILATREELDGLIADKAYLCQLLWPSGDIEKRQPVNIISKVIS